MLFIWLKGFFVFFFAVGFAAFLGYFFVRKARGKPATVSRSLLFAVFCGYVAGMLSITLDLLYPSGEAMAVTTQVNLVPFHGIRIFLGNLGTFNGRINLFGNILMFAPMGFLLPALWRKKHPILFGTAGTALLSLVIELLQLTSYRYTDIDDLIMNTLGGLIGAGFYTLLFSKRRERQNPPVS